MAEHKKVFAEEDMARYKRVFNMFDINKNGVIEAKELATVAKVLGYKVDKEKVLGIIKMLDLEHVGTLTFENFLQAMPGKYEMLPEDEHRREEYREKFKEFDKNNDGVISLDECQEVLSEMLGFSEEKTKLLLHQYDYNEDGVLSYEEFVGFYLTVKQKKKTIDEAFKKFDQDDKGYVSPDDAKRILSTFEFSDEEIEDMVKLHDTNKDGLLQYNEFVHFWSV